MPLAEVNLRTLAELLAGATAIVEELRSYYLEMPILHAVYQWMGYESAVCYALRSGLHVSFVREEAERFRLISCQS